MSAIAALALLGGLLAAPETLPAEGAALRIVQRHAAALPGPLSGYRLILGDITRGQVLAAVEPQAGGPAVFSASMRPDELHILRLGDATYTLRVEQMVNYLIGDDFAVIRVRAEAAAAPPATPSPATAAAPATAAVPAATIDGLLADLERAEVVFLREGQAYDGRTAAAHLRQKWAHAPQVREPEVFIRELASRSSMTGRPYRVRLRDGREIDAATYLTERLSALRAAEHR